MHVVRVHLTTDLRDDLYFVRRQLPRRDDLPRVAHVGGVWTEHGRHAKHGRAEYPPLRLAIGAHLDIDTENELDDVVNEKRGTFALADTRHDAEHLALVGHGLREVERVSCIVERVVEQLLVDQHRVVDELHAVDAVPHRVPVVLQRLDEGVKDLVVLEVV